MKNHVVCLSTTNYHPLPTRKQNVMSRLRNSEVLYFDPPVSIIAPLKDKKASAYISKYRQPGEKVEGHENITVYALPPVLPFFNKFRWVNRLNQKRQAAFVRRKMREHGFGDETVLWCYSPSSCDIVEQVPHSSLVYDCVDRHSAYGGLMNPELVDAMELELAGKCSRVFATAEPLAKRLKAANEKTAFIPNGADYERFAQANDEQPVPSDLKDIPHPIFGFVGALQPCVEYGYVETAAKAHPDWSFVFIGGEKPGAKLDVLRTLQNVHFLGLKPNELLPQYLAHFDACLNLFADNALSRDVSPLKFYEYLATGRPIVSTPQPEQVMQYAPLIQVATNPEEFSVKCAESLLDDLPERRAARMTAGRGCSWDARVAQMCKYLRDDKIL